MSTTTPVSGVSLRLLTTLKWPGRLPWPEVAGLPAWSPPFAPVPPHPVHKSVHKTTGRPGDQSRDPEVRLGPGTMPRWRASHSGRACSESSSVDTGRAPAAAVRWSQQFPICLEPCRGHHPQWPGGRTAPHPVGMDRRADLAESGSDRLGERCRAPTGLLRRVREHRRGHLRVCPAGELRANPVEDQQGCAGNLPASAFALPTGKNGSAAPCTTSVGAVISGSRSRQRGVQSSFENTALSRPLRADAGCGPERSRTPAAWTRASAASNCGEPENTRAAATAPSRIDVRSVQSTGGAQPKWAMIAGECSGRSSSTGPGEPGQVPAARARRPATGGPAPGAVR